MKLKDEIVKWIKDWFEENGKDCKAVVGCSGGKDSSVVAALCAEALGKDRVLGVLMPDGEQQDIDYSYKLVEFLKIPYIKINIKDCKDKLIEQLHNSYLSMTGQAKCNLPPRLRMSTLYAVAQCVDGRVLNTCNLSETLLGWETRWGDAVGDLAPIADLTVTEVKQLGYELSLPKELIEKTPSDGLCGSSDEEKLGISYSIFDKYIRTGICEDEEMKKKIDERIKATEFKRKPIPKFVYSPNNRNTEIELEKIFGCDITTIPIKEGWGVYVADQNGMCKLVEIFLTKSQADEYAKTLGDRKTLIHEVTLR